VFQSPLGHEIGDGDRSSRVVHHPEILHVDAEELAAVLAEVPIVNRTSRTRLESSLKSAGPAGNAGSRRLPGARAPAAPSRTRAEQAPVARARGGEARRLNGSHDRARAFPARFEDDRSKIDGRPEIAAVGIDTSRNPRRAQPRADLLPGSTQSVARLRRATLEEHLDAGAGHQHDLGVLRRSA